MHEWTHLCHTSFPVLLASTNKHLYSHCGYEWLSQSSLVSSPFKIYLLFSYCISSSKVSSMLHPYVEQSTAAPVWNIQLHMQSCANAVYIALMFIIHVRYMQCIVTCSASSLWSVKVLKHNPNLAALVTSPATNVSLQPIHALSRLCKSWKKGLIQLYLS